MPTNRGCSEKKDQTPAARNYNYKDNVDVAGADRGVRLVRTGAKPWWKALTPESWEGGKEKKRPDNGAPKTAVKENWGKLAGGLLRSACNTGGVGREVAT